MKYHLLAGLKRPAAGVCRRAVGAVAEAGDGIVPCRRAAVTVTDVRFRQIVRVLHFQTLPRGKDNMQVRREAFAGIEVCVHELVLLGKAEDLAVQITLGDQHHLAEIRPVRDVTGDMEAEKPGRHDRRLDLAPVGVRVAVQEFEVGLVGIADGRPETLQLVRVALVRAGTALPACYNRRKRDAWNLAEL